MSVDSDRDCCHHHKKCSKCRRRCPRCRFECDIECRECPRCRHCFDNCCECCECGFKHDHCWQIYGRPTGRFSYTKKINHAVANVVTKGMLWWISLEKLTTRRTLVTATEK